MVTVKKYKIKFQFDKMEEFEIAFNAKVDDLKKYREGIHYLGFFRSEERNKNEGFDTIHDIRFSYDAGKKIITAKGKTADKKEAEGKVKDLLKKWNYI
jgi:hypothetical protein